MNTGYLPRRTGAAKLALVAISSLALSAPSDAPACGFHTPESISRALLSWKYPDASHVSGAIWRGQQAGVLEMPDPRRLQATGAEREFRNQAAYASALRALHALGAALAPAPGEDPGPSVALVLHDPMLWTRYPGDGSIEPHVDGPGDADLVIVSDAPVLEALESGRVTIAESADQGYLRLYGAPAKQDAFLALHGEVGARPIALGESARRALVAQMLGRPPRTGSVAASSRGAGAGP